jgi:exodeoxyribonuclease III
VRIVSSNLNGLRSAGEKGYFTWLARQKADVVCLQETRADPAAVDKKLAAPRGWICHHHVAEKKGYSGVAIYSRVAPDRVVTGLGHADIDREGRWLQFDFGALSVVSLYLPSGSSGEPRQTFKYDVMRRLAAHLAKLRRDGRDYVVAGDWNIAHRQIDIENWRSNQKNSGFLPEERAWLDALLAPDGWVDAFRVVNDQPREYTWWSARGNARANNVGWRIDYQIVTPRLGARVKAASIYRARAFSDHAPLIVDYDL